MGSPLGLKGGRGAARSISVAHRDAQAKGSLHRVWWPQGCHQGAAQQGCHLVLCPWSVSCHWAAGPLVRLPPWQQRHQGCGLSLVLTSRGFWDKCALFPPAVDREQGSALAYSSSSPGHRKEPARERGQWEATWSPGKSLVPCTGGGQPCLSPFPRKHLLREPGSHLPI